METVDKGQERQQREADQVGKGGVRKGIGNEGKGTTKGARKGKDSTGDVTKGQGKGEGKDGKGDVTKGLGKGEGKDGKGTVDC